MDSNGELRRFLVLLRQKGAGIDLRGSADLFCRAVAAKARGQHDDAGVGWSIGS